MRMTWLAYPLLVIAIVALSMTAWRQIDHRRDSAAWSDLSSLAGAERGVFDLSMVAGLPEPAQRYFTFSIEPGTPIVTAVEIEMTGELGQGTKDSHNYEPMQATQILAPPHGLVWKVKAGALSGSDGAMADQSWTRFWLFNLVPVVRASGPDHMRSAFGRVVAEAAIWVPGSLLPSDQVTWEPVDADRARAVVRFNDFLQAIDITVDPDGRPTDFLIQRWSNVNADAVYREQPFGGTVSDFETFGGYRLPTRVDGGNHFGTDAYYPFYKANVVSITPVKRPRRGLLERH